MELFIVDFLTKFLFHHRMVANGITATLRQINDIYELEENSIVVPQKSAKAITAKITEVKPYKWIEVIDSGKRKVEEEFLKKSRSVSKEKYIFLSNRRRFFFKEEKCQIWAYNRKIAHFTGVKYIKSSFISTMVGHSSLGFNSFSRGR